jgi:hypothetical protein
LAGLVALLTSDATLSVHGVTYISQLSQEFAA